ncbi:bifunctional 4-hydroxy-2-oxoglutarate aldolase/2-dehydro-3-deoxy-phosphogluconate aldolase [Streptomyces sp. MJP52]|uniref:bifunctional 4-hydroxy-2-oxoglutarate aldolase/2-dehydro-3-deoxy-phosphogluconate aldolase n=1 Tax=Streptomyces sp. MJP52 TaxID=2940555 RepID=UPI0024762127|nr:bifunctional 4-hydroxy-2-oxoglutarate aldolase/2-dehydro-3-deoxy-phosphogluconate aldolase [Streptomyces sp. MJP52]MDH6228407.1 2-dehydro-3-deoxyphosphogluconate aldolase/(4S)-4-hydroxy-2-oxoglutarate aldolase [Streptomyces sp. MJP52]
MSVPLSPVLLESRVIAVLRAADASFLRPAAEALAEEGVRSFEVTLTTVGGVDAIADLAGSLGPDAEVGAGTVLTVEDLEAVLAAGARYVVTPHTDPGLIRAAVRRGVPIVPGGLTPTELRTGWAAGASAVKLFPASAVGPRYVKDLHGPFPGMPVIPSGGVDRASAGEWIRVGCPAVSLGGPLLGDALAGGDLGELRLRAREVVKGVAEAAAEVSGG